MSAVLGVTGPIFALIGLGWLVTRRGLFHAGRPAGARALRGDAGIAGADLPGGDGARPRGAGRSAAISPPTWAGRSRRSRIGYGLSRRAGLDGAASTFQAMGMSCANSGFIGYPMLLIAMPALADRALALNMIVENLVMIPLVLILAEGSRPRRRARRTARRVATNPIVLALAAGLAVALTPRRGAGGARAGDRPRGPVERGGVAGGDRRHARRGAAGAGRAAGSAAVVAGKLLLHPLAVAGGFALLRLAGVAGRPGDGGGRRADGGDAGDGDLSDPRRPVRPGRAGGGRDAGDDASAPSSRSAACSGCSGRPGASAS